MIFLQIVAGLLLLPLLVISLLLFNLYLVHFFYFLFIALFALIFSALFGLLFHSSSVAASIFIIFIALYSLRSCYLASRFDLKNQNYPAIRGEINASPFSFRLFFPLNFLKILKWIPNFVAREIKKNLQLEMSIPELVDLVLQSCRGAQLDIQTEEANVYFEIQ